MPRMLLRPEITVDRLKELCKEKTTIVHYKGDTKLFEQTLQNKGIIWTTTEKSSDEKVNLNDNRPTLVLTKDAPTKVDQRSHHQLVLTLENSLQWLESRVETRTTSILANNVNILCGEPGIGKTTMMKFLARNCSPDHWVAIVSMKTMNHTFGDKLTSENVFRHCLTVNGGNALNERFAVKFFKDKKVIFFFDGLNELSKDLLDRAASIIEELVIDGYKIWASSTTYLKCFDREVLRNSHFYKMEGFKKRQQVDYFTRRLKSANIPEKNIYQMRTRIFVDHAENNDILKLPLTLFLLTEILSREEGLTKFEEGFTLNQMFESFLEGELYHNLEKHKCKDDCSTLDGLGALIVGFKNYYVKGCQLAALQTCLTDDLISSLRIKTDEDFVQYIRQKGNFLDFVQLDDGSNSLVFIHHTFAEYFTGEWLSGNFEEIPQAKRAFILKSEYSSIRRFFDTKLAEKCPLHLAVLDADISRIKKYEQDYWNTLDKGGRTPLHLAVSLGKKHPLLNKKEVRKSEDVYSDRKHTRHHNVLAYLLRKPKDVLAVDTLLSWNLFEYADASLCLFALNELANNGQLQWNDLKTYRNHLYTLVYYCVTMGYTKVLQAAVQNEGWETIKRECKDIPLLILALENRQKEVAILLIESGIHLEKRNLRDQTPLHLAAIWGQLEIIELLLKKKVDIQARDELESTPLHLAARMGNTHIVEFLVSNGAQVDAENKEKKTPLQAAAYLGRTEVVKYLLKRGSDINAKNTNKQHALHRAAAAGHRDTVEYLLNAGADKDAIDKYKRTPLHHATLGEHDDVVACLVKQEVNVLAADEDGKTARSYAIEKKNSTLVELLTSAEREGSSRITENSSASELHEAARSGNLEAVERLLNDGANIEELNRDKETALHIACRAGQLDIVKLLITKGANTATTNSDNQVPLHHACQKGHEDIVRELLGKGQDNFPDKWGVTPLHRAAYKGHKNVVELLVENKVDLLKSLTVENATIFHSAARGGHVDIIEYLFSKNVNSMKKNIKGETCLHAAVQKGCTDAVEYLIKKEKKIIDEVDDEKATALHFAVERGLKSMVRVLVEGGANIHLKNAFDETPMDVAKKGNRKEIIEILKHSNEFTLGNNSI